jgi:hypothetical protein
MNIYQLTKGEKMKKLIIVVVLLLIALPVFAQNFAGVQADEKGSYVLNKYGSKMRFASDEDKKNKEAGRPYGLILKESDMSQSEKDARAQDALKAEDSKAKQDEERLISERANQIMRAEAVKQLVAEGKIKDGSR